MRVVNKTFYGVDKLTETARLNLLAGNLEVYDIMHKHLNAPAKRTAYQYRFNGRSVIFSFGGRNKILIYNG
jgi:hypothetical protein